MTGNFSEPAVLGRTGLKVSRLGIGSGYKAPAAAIEKAFHERGVNYFYWSSPRRSGMQEAIKNLVPTHRENIVIAFQSYDHLGMFMQRFHEKGLKTLGIDCADVLILGWRNKIPSKRVIDAAIKLKEQGKVRYLAMSGHKRSAFGKMAQSGDLPIDIFMIRYNAAHRGAEEDIFPYLPDENRPGITIYTATCWGKLLKQSKMPAGEKPLTSAECYRFVLSNPNVDLCMTGPADQRQMDEALITLDAGSLTDEEMERIRRIGHHVHG